MSARDENKSDVAYAKIATSAMVENIFFAEILYVLMARKIVAKMTPIHTPLDCE